MLTAEFQFYDFRLYAGAKTIILSSCTWSNDFRSNNVNSDCSLVDAFIQISLFESLQPDDPSSRDLYDVTFTFAESSFSTWHAVRSDRRDQQDWIRC